MEIFFFLGMSKGIHYFGAQEPIYNYSNIKVDHCIEDTPYSYTDEYHYCSLGETL